MVEYASEANVTTRTQVKYTNLGLTANEYSLLINALLITARKMIDDYTGRDFQLYDYSSAGMVISVGDQNLHSIAIPGPVAGTHQNPSDDITKVQTRGGKGDSWSDMDSEEWSIVQPDPMHSKIRTADEIELMKIAFGTNEFIQGRIGSSSSTYNRRIKGLWTQGYENIKIFYKVGFLTVPDAIREICVTAVDELLIEAVNKHNMQVRTREDFVTLMKNMGLSNNIKSQLRPYLSIRGRISVVGV